MGMKRHLPVIPFIITGTGIFFANNNHPVFLILSTAIIAIGFWLRSSRLPFWIFLIITQIMIQITGERLNLLFTPLILINPHPLFNFYLLGSEAVANLISGNLLFNVIPLAVFTFVSHLFHNEINSGLDRLRYELNLIKRRSEFIISSEVDSERLLSAFKISPHPAIFRPILHFLSYLRENFDAQTIAFFYRKGDELTLILGVSVVKGFREEVHLKATEGILGYAIKNRKEIIIPEYDISIDQLGYYRNRRVKIKSVAIVPVFFGNEIEGVLVFDSQKRSYTDEDRESLKNGGFTFTYLVGMVRLYEQQRRNAVHYSALYELAKRLQKELDFSNITRISAEVALTIFGCDHVGIASVDRSLNQGEVLYSEGLRELPLHTTFSLDEGLIGWIAKYGRYLLNNQLKKGKVYRIKRGETSHPYNSFIGVPISVEDSVIGVIWVESRTKNVYREEDADLLNFLAFQLSLAWNRANLHKRISELAIRDSLTGLYNHRHFHEEFDRLLKTVKRLVLIMIDIDHFKTINDENGHQVGDQVLLGIARVLSGIKGISARYGGEEFVVIFPDISEKNGVEAAIRLKERIKSQEIRIKEKTIKTTVSIGLAFYPQDGTTKEELISKADSALYRAKQAGRDRVCVAEKEES